MTTDVSHVTFSHDCSFLNITCHLLPGSLAKGCLVLFHCLCENAEEGKQYSLNETIPRLNLSLEARAVLLLSQYSCCHKFEVYDWETEGHVGVTPIPLKNNSVLCNSTAVVTDDGTGNSDIGTIYHQHKTIVPHLFIVTIIIYCSTEFPFLQALGHI